MDLILQYDISLVGHIEDGQEYLPEIITEEMLEMIAEYWIGIIQSIDDDLYVELNRTDPNAIISVYDIYGNLVSRAFADDEQVRLKGTSGINFITLTVNGEIVETKQIMK